MRSQTSRKLREGRELTQTSWRLEVPHHQSLALNVRNVAVQVLNAVIGKLSQIQRQKKSRKRVLLLRENIASVLTFHNTGGRRRRSVTRIAIGGYEGFCPRTFAASLPFDVHDRVTCRGSRVSDRWFSFDSRRSGCAEVIRRVLVGLSVVVRRVRASRRSGIYLIVVPRMSGGPLLIPIIPCRVGGTSAANSR
jgi:hypothetical protein